MVTIHDLDGRSRLSVNLAALDMNLIVALRALLEERNVTRAGQRVGLSQPAMSAALARLRRHFGDDLLARHAGSYELTALGAVLLDRAVIACEMLERVFASQAQFDPSEEDREFTILASDYAVAVFGVHLAQAVHAVARASGSRSGRCQAPSRRTPAECSVPSTACSCHTE
jgi:DNA-binding transcriptional LysR family regulator